MTCIRAEMLSDIGRRRKRNEDTIGHWPPSPEQPESELGALFVLADGVGGAAAGEIASREAVRHVIRAYYDQSRFPSTKNPLEDTKFRLLNSVKIANRAVHKMGQANVNMKWMSTTIVLAAIRDHTVTIASVGDSPAFLIRNNEIRKLTIDHTFAEMQSRGGLLSHREAWLHPDRHKLVRTVGRISTVDVDVVNEALEPGDYVLLCSDGLTRYVLPAEMKDMVNTKSLDHAVHDMVECANNRGGSDNISVIAIEVLPDKQRAI